MTALMTGKTALVTGAGSGIGAATARILAAEGARVAVGYHNDADGAAAVVESLPGEGHIALRCKIDDADSLAAAVDELQGAFGHLDVLVNSAGSTTPVPLHDLDALDDALFDRIVRINLRAPFSAIRNFAPLLRNAPDDAVIVNVGSLAAYTGSGSNLAYAAAKAGLAALSKGLARVLGPKIRVLSVAPAGVDTDFVKGRDPALLKKHAGAVPLKKATTPDDVARSVLACAALLTSSTGIDVIVDEGRHVVGWPL